MSKYLIEYGTGLTCEAIELTPGLRKILAEAIKEEKDLKVEATFTYHPAKQDEYNTPGSVVILRDRDPHCDRDLFYVLCTSQGGDPEAFLAGPYLDDELGPVWEIITAHFRLHWDWDDPQEYERKAGRLEARLYGETFKDMPEEIRPFIHVIEQ